MHSVQLIDVERIQQLCVEKGKDAHFRIRVHEFLVVVGSHVRTWIAHLEFNLKYCLIVDKEGHIEKKSNDVDELSSQSSLSEFTDTPAYSPFEESIEERDDNSLVVEVDCEVSTTGEGSLETLYKPLPYGQAYFNRKPRTMAHMKNTARKTGKPVKGKPARFPKGENATPKPSMFGGGKGRGKGKGPKKLITKTLKVGCTRRKNSGAKCRVMKKVTMAQEGRRHRYRPGTKALMEKAYYQKPVGLCMAKAAFGRVVREICAEDLIKRA